MITERDKRTIQEISTKFKAKRVLLFGSSLYSTKDSHDIDIAVEGIDPKVFFKYYGDLLLKLSKPIDVIDLAGTSKFVQLVEQEGVDIYG